MPPVTWQPPPDPLTLRRDEVHIWRASLALDPASLPGLRQILSGDEQARANRFHFERDRRRFIAARGILRHIISYYTKITPDQILFDYTPYGKPGLMTAPHNPVLRFNLSHSGEFALYALTLAREIGIDLEQIRPMPDDIQLAQKFFSARENQTFQTVPLAHRTEAFFNCWTRKEAYIKALGEGLSHPLDTFDVSLVPGEPAAILAIRGNTGEANRWSLHAFEPVPGYVAALAVEAQHYRLSYWDWGLPEIQNLL